MNIREITYTDHGGSFQRVRIITQTSVKAITAAGEALLEAHAEFDAIHRERLAAMNDPARFAEEARVAAVAAGASGKKVDAKKLRRKVREAEDRLGEITLEWEVAMSNLQTQRWAYSAAIEHHAPALAAEAATGAEAGIMALASAQQIARKGEAELSGSLAIMAALAATRDGGEFIPTAPRARSGGSGGIPGVHAQIAIDGLGQAIGYGAEILRTLTEAEKAEAKRAKLQAEADAAPDIDDEPDDDDDDDDEPEAAPAQAVAAPVDDDDLGLDPDLYDIPGQEDDD